MPEIYSVPSLPGKTTKKDQPINWVNTNAVFQSILQQLDAEERKAIVLRCDDMPQLQGSEEELKNLFSVLLQLILQEKDTVSRLFLHINCVARQQDSPALAGEQYTIQFNTNIVVSANWCKVHAQQLASIALQLQKNNGSLETAVAQGCFFSLSLPGKPL